MGGITIPIERSKTKAKALEAAKNPFIDYESVENPEECDKLEAVGEQEIDYVASDVEEQEEVQPEEKGNEDKEEGEGEKNEIYEGEDYLEEEPDLEEEEVVELLPCSSSYILGGTSTLSKSLSNTKNQHKI